MRADLRREYGISLTQMFEGEISPDEVWDYVTHLPRNSATWSAVFDDPETVISDEPGEMKLSEYSPEVELLSDCYDMLAALLAQVQSLGSKTAVKVKPHRRPGEARRERLRAERSAQARAEWSDFLKLIGIPE